MMTLPPGLSLFCVRSHILLPLEVFRAIVIRPDVSIQQTKKILSTSLRGGSRDYVHDHLI